MQNRTSRIDLVKLLLFVLKYVWVVILCAAVGFAGMYWYRSSRAVETFTASGTMYVYNGNPNLVNYGYTSSGDISSAVRLIDTYTVVVKSDKVMDVVAERLTPQYPEITPGYIRGTISMSSVSETGVVRVTCRTRDPQMSADICNTVIDVAPAEIIRVVSAGSIEVVDYATVPTRADGMNLTSMAMTGALGGAVLAAAVLALIFLLNRKITDTKEINENFTPPVLSSVRRTKEEHENPGDFLLEENSSMELLENYAKLRMNLLFTLVGKESHTVVITSAISGEGKSTISANLAVSCAMAEKKVLLIDGDLRRACQRDIFWYDKDLPGLSDVLVGLSTLDEAILQTKWDCLDILPSGKLPPNPAEILSTQKMRDILKEAEEHYDLVLIDAPPVNIVSDALTLSDAAAGCLFVIRQNYSDDREVRKALKAAELTRMEVLGFVFYGERLHGTSYYSQRYYNKYYHKYYGKYDHRPGAENAEESEKSGSGHHHHHSKK